jgi:hypothetical protein
MGFGAGFPAFSTVASACVVFSRLATFVPLSAHSGLYRQPYQRQEVGIRPNSDIAVCAEAEAAKYTECQAAKPAAQVSTMAGKAVLGASDALSGARHAVNNGSEAY